MGRRVSTGLHVGLAAALLLLVLFVLTVVAPARAHAQEGDSGDQNARDAEIAESLKVAYEDGQFQPNLPGRPTPIASDGSGLSVGLDPKSAPDGSTAPTTTSSPPGLGLFQGLGTILFYGVVLAVVAVFVWWCFAQWLSSQGDVALPGDDRRDDRSLSDEGARLRPRQAAREDALSHAAAGWFLEGAHVLLLDGLARSVAGGMPLEVAVTSREFLRSLPDESERREPLTVLVATVEQGLFAGRPLDRRQFEQSLTSFDQIVAAGPLRRASQELQR